ncbi:MAG: hypothetical protein IJS09_10990 [Treponema sp.]|nr:hypothetical protein [Treponema sp.]
MKGLASRGKSTKGWFFGFKLQGICTADGTIIKLCFRPGKKHDSQSFVDIIENVWSVMKLNYNLIYHRARSATGMFRHFFYSISAFLFHLVEDAQKWFLLLSSPVAKLEF